MTGAVRPRVSLAALAVACVFAASSAVQAAVDFRAAAGPYIGKEHREYFEYLLSAKPATADNPIKSLMALQTVAASIGARPLQDLSDVARDPVQSGSIWMAYAEKLYLEEKYVESEEALRRVSDAFQDANAERVDALKIRLALRGIGRFPQPSAIQGTDPVRELNWILAGLSKGDVAGAITRLRALASDSRQRVDLRHRAMILAAVLLHQTGAKQDALATLSAVDGASQYQIDVLMAFMRLNESINAGQITAIERQLAARGGNSPLLWEARANLIKSLRDNGADGQAAEKVIEAINSISAALGAMQQEVVRIRQMPFADVLKLTETLPESRRSRAESLRLHKENIAKIAELLRKWRPHIASYHERLTRDRTRFEDELREAQFSTSGELEKDSSRLASLFHLEMGKLIGKPASDDSLYRMFFGLVQWEFAYEYPPGWRPSFETEAKQTDRRRRRGVAAQKAADDQVFLPMAMAHVEKLAWKIAERLSHFPRYTSTAIAQTILDRSAETLAEIDRVLPEIDRAIREETALAVRDRKKVAETWLNHFAAQAIADNVKVNAGKEYPYLVLDGRISPQRGQSLVQTLVPIETTTSMKAAKEVPLAGVYEALKPVVLTGESKTILADALLIRAQLGIALYEAQAINSLDDTINHYSTLLRDHADRIDVADVTYQLARAQDLGQQMEKSLATLESFAKKFPSDPRAYETFFRIAEYLFSLSEYPRAKPAYEKVIKQGDKRYVDQAEYKLAWTMFKLGDFRGALPRFIAVIDRGFGDEGGDDISRRNRMQDALRATALTFSNLEGPAEVERYFVGKAQRPYVPEIYQTLARYYLDHRRVADGSATYNLLHKHYPDHPQAAVLLADLAVGARREALAKISLELQELFVNRYSITSPYWAKASEDTRKQILGHMKPFAAQLGQMYHADAQQQKKPESYALAIKYYSQYVATFPDDKDTPPIHFLLADARFETGDLENAIVDYEKLAYGYGPHEKAAESGYALLLATQKLIEKETEVTARKAKLATLVERSARFSNAFPGDLRVEAVLVKASEDILAVGDPKEAIRLSENLLARNPSEEVKRRASQVLAHGLFESGSFVKAEAAYVKALEFKGIAAKDAKEMTERLGLSVYRQAEGLVAAGNPAAAIDTFLRVGKAAPGTEAVPNSVIEATVLMANAKRWPEVIVLLEEFPRRFPGHKLAATVPVRIAVAYESDGKFLKAADTLEGLSQTETDEQLARAMLWRAAELREKGERVPDAVATFERYLKRYPQPVEKATEVRQLLADYATKASDLPTRDRWLSELITVAKTPAGLESVRVRFLAAKAAVQFGDDNAALFSNIRLTQPLDKSLAEKRKSMEGALRWFEDASRFGVLEVTTNATYKTAEIYRSMAKEIMASERPKGLNELEIGQYNLLLEEQATPIEEKATEIHEINYARIAKGNYDEWIKKSVVSLRALFAGKYDKVEVAVGYFPYVPPKPAPAPPGATPSSTGGTSNAPAVTGTAAPKSHEIQVAPAAAPPSPPPAVNDKTPPTASDEPGRAATSGTSVPSEGEVK